MAKVGYKLQEFVAHSGNLNCLSFGKKNCRLFITGGDDQKVNLWSVGKPTSLMSLCGHTSPVESAAFDSAEVSVVAGSSSGAIKLWDLEETTTVRTLTGHRSYCRALEFHPFGELLASGSMDRNLKIWDIRKKGCIHTYKGHARGISTIRFTPDGRWVVSGGFDNVVKVWDLTAGKLLHDLKFHEGRIRAIEFHPLEFLLATGSADKTVKFWDLETFEMIGSSRCEVSGVRSMTFHPDGRMLFCGLDDSLKVYSWEPVICHDSVNMGWSTLGDLCIHDGKLLGGAYYENSVSVWVLDASLIEPYAAKAATKQQSDFDEIKTIYVDCVNPVAPKEVGPAVHSPDPKDIRTVGIQKRAPAVSKSIMPRDGPPGGKNPEASRRESMSSVRTGGCASVKPAHVRRLSTGKFDMRRMSDSLDSAPRDAAKSSFCGRKKEMNIRNSLVPDGNAKKLPETKQFSSIESVAGKFNRHLPPAISSSVAIGHGKMLNSVERFERKEKVEIDEIQTPDRNGDGEIVSASGENAVIENLMQSHDLLLNIFRSRLTKLQAVVHVWERNDIKGAINVVAKLPDHSVEADVIGVLVDRMELITLDLFSCLLPVLLDLLDSKVERHASISLEMLLKLVAVFGTLIRTTVSGSRAVEVNNLQADESFESCKQCYSHLQSVKKILPDLVKRGGDVTRYAQQLNLVLNQT